MQRIVMTVNVVAALLAEKTDLDSADGKPGDSASTATAAIRATAIVARAVTTLFSPRA